MAIGIARGEVGEIEMGANAIDSASPPGFAKGLFQSKLLQDGDGFDVSVLRSIRAGKIAQLCFGQTLELVEFILQRGYWIEWRAAEWRQSGCGGQASIGKRCVSVSR